MRGISTIKGLMQPGRIAVTIVALMLLAAAGCYSPGRSRVSTVPGVTTNGAPTRLGRVGLLVQSEVPAFSFRYPRTTGGAIVHTAGKTWDFIGLDDGVDEVVASSVVSGITGVIWGGITGVPEAEIQRGEAALLRVLREYSIMEGISNQVLESFADAGYPPPIVIPQNLSFNLLTANLAERDYSPLKALGVESVMEISVESYGFRARERSNPPMKLGAKVAVQVTRLADTNTVLRTLLRYHGHQHRFMRWAADDAQQFRSDLKRIGRMVGRNAVEGVLSNPEAQPE